MDPKDLQTIITHMETARREISAGKRIATAEELIFGMPFSRNDLTCDAQQWYGGLRKSLKASDHAIRLASLIESFSQLPTPGIATMAREETTDVLEHLGDAVEIYDLDLQNALLTIIMRLDIYSAELGDQEAAARMAAASMREAVSAYNGPVHKAEALTSTLYFAEIAGGARSGPLKSKARREARSRADKAIARAFADFKTAVDATDTWALQRAVDDVIAESTKPAVEEKKKTGHKATETPPAAEDDLSHIPRYQPPGVGLAELSARFRREKEPEYQPPGITVLGSLRHLPADSGKNSGESIRSQFKSLEKRHIPLVECAAPAGIYADLVDRFPWAEAAIATIIKEVGRRDFVRIRPTLLVGPPGTGKTKLAMELTRALGLMPTKFSCAGVSDSSFSGTSRQWSTARVSVPMQAIQRSMIANPAIVLDEIEKTATGSQNGALTAALLDFLERSSAKGVFDPALECPVDLSGVVYIATANSLAGLPAALANRFRILHIPAPSPEHLEELCRSILDDHAAEEELDRRWIPDLDFDELAAVRSVWKGGSVRPLKAAVEATLQAREEFAPRM